MTEARRFNRPPTNPDRRAPIRDSLPMKQAGLFWFCSTTCEKFRVSPGKAGDKRGTFGSVSLSTQSKRNTHPIMKTKLVVFCLLSAAFLAGSARAQIVQPATPAPAVPAIAPSAALVPNQTIYSPRLPGVNEVTAIAAAQGLTVERIEQTSSQITVVYKNANGQTNTVAYLLLPGTAVASTQGVAQPTPAPAVVYYEPAPRVVYYDGYSPGYYYSPSYWYPPVSIGLGFDFRGGGRGGFHGGGFRGGGFRGGFGFHH